MHPRRVLRGSLPVVAWLTAAAGGVLLACLPTSSAHAADFNVSAHTVGQFFEYVRVDNDVVPRRRLTQYLQLNGFDLLGDGENQLSFKSSFRFDTDLGLLDEPLDEPSAFALERRFNAFHLLYAYIEGRELWNHLSFKLGRQLHTDVLGWYDFDGLYASVRIVGGLHVDFYGGVEVKADTFVLNDAAFDPDGTSPAGSRFQLFDNTVYGLGAVLKWVDQTSTRARVSYRRTFWQIQSGVETDRLGAWVEQRLFDRLKFFGGAAFNFFITDVDYAETGVEWSFADPDVTLAAEYMRQIPTFDADSIFNVFNVQPYDDVRARVGWQITEDLYTMLRLGTRIYHGEDAYESELSSDLMFTGRLLVRWRPGLGIWTSLVHQSEAGFGGRKHYTSIAADSPWYHDLWSISARVNHLEYDADYTTRYEGHSFGANLGAGIKLGPYGSFQLALEQAVNRFVDSELRAYGVLDLDFWF